MFTKLMSEISEYCSLTMEDLTMSEVNAVQDYITVEQQQTDAGFLFR